VEFILLLLVFLVLVALGWAAYIELRYQRLARSFRALMTGRAGADLESVLLEQVGRVARAEQTLGVALQRLQNLETQQPFQIQHLGVVRFNPFQDRGGDQSFCIAMLDGHTDGIVITCLHSRVDLRLYAKSVVGGQSTITLTPEEKEAIARAMKPRA